MYEVYFCYKPRTIILVDWKDYMEIMGDKYYDTIVYGEHWDWEWNKEYVPFPIDGLDVKKENIMEYADMEDCIKKLFGRGW